MEATTANQCPYAKGRPTCMCPVSYSRCAGWTRFPEMPVDPAAMFCDDHGMVPVIDGSRRCPECSYDI